MNETSHIIEKLILEVNTSRIDTAHAIKNSIDSFFNRELSPLLEKLFAEYDLPDAILRFDELLIDLSVSDWTNTSQLKLDLTDRLDKRLKSSIQIDFKSGKPVFSVINQEDIRVRSLSVTENYAEIFFYFLKNGCYPWYGVEQQIRELEKKENWEKFFANKAFVSKLKALTLEYNWMFQRFVWQFPTEMILAFLSKINPVLVNFERDLLKMTRKLNAEIRNELLLMLFTISTQQETTRVVSSIQRNFEKLKEKNDRRPAVSSLPDVLSHLIILTVPKKVISNKQIQAIISQRLPGISGKGDPGIETHPSGRRENREATVSKKPDEIQEIAVPNAGLILVHPFLKQFFKQISLTDGQNHIRSEKLAVAVQSLHYLATENEDFFEGNLVLEKFLCGIPPGMPVQKRSKLTAKIRNEAKILLNEVIKNWPALKNTSPDGLRQLFLQRNGKLIREKENRFRLVVERKAQDLLLEKLAWNLSLVKLPWRKDLLYVDW